MPRISQKESLLLDISAQVDVALYDTVAASSKSMHDALSIVALWSGYEEECGAKRYPVARNPVSKSREWIDRVLGQYDEQRFRIYTL